MCERSNIEELEPRWKLNSEIPPSLWHEMTGFTCWAKKLINKNVINRDRGRDRLSHFSLSAKYFEAIDYSPADLHSMLQIENKIGLSNFREMENWSKRFFGRGGWELKWPNYLRMLKVLLKLPRNVNGETFAGEPNFSAFSFLAKATETIHGSWRGLSIMSNTKEVHSRHTRHDVWGFCQRSTA